jgi:ATP-dependent Clp protease ATP-binding subunit ClpA
MTFGARPLARLIQEYVKKPLAEELLFGRLQKGGAVVVDMEDDKLVFTYPGTKDGMNSETVKETV